jgi:hypothetical protein
MELIKKIFTDYRSKFLRDFLENPHHQWILDNPNIKRCFLTLFMDLKDEHVKYLSKRKVHFLFSQGEMSVAVTHQKNESIIVVFPDLYKLMISSLMPYAQATLAHEIGHIYGRHSERSITAMNAQIEADQFAIDIGYGEDLYLTLKNYEDLPEVKERLKIIKEKIS